VKFPEIWARPLKSEAWMTGAEMTFPSRTIAILPRIRVAQRPDVAPGEHQRVLDRLLGTVRVAENQLAVPRSRGKARPTRMEKAS